MNTNAPARFLSALMQPYALHPSLMLEIRPLWPEWKLPELYPTEEPPWWWRSQTGRRQWFPLSAVEAAAKHCQRACGETDVYMGVLPREGRKGGREDVPCAAWLWCDVDGGGDVPEGSVRLLKESGLPRPHIAVMSGGGLHAYWRLVAPEPLESDHDRQAFKEILRRLCNHVGGEKQRAHADSTRADTASILRVPDTWNWKRETEPRPVRLVRFQPEEEAMHLHWWGATLPAMPLPPERETRPITPGEIRPLPPKAVSILQSSWPPGTRHTALRELLAIARGCCGFDLPAIELLAETFATQNAGRREWARKLAQDTCRRIQPSYN